MTDSDFTTAFYDPSERTEEPTVVLLPGMVLNNKYALLAQIGRGGMGVVWKAQDQVADRLVALKFVPRELKRFAVEMERVRVSFRKVHALNHQWICPIYDLEDGGELGYYLVMKYLDGEALDNFMKRKDPQRQGLPPDQVVAILSRVAVALDYAHLNRVIHRDIKPGNIFLIKVAGKLHVQLIDFGLVDEIRTSLSRVSQMQFDISGTRPYMAPEQWLGKLQSEKTDQYALAVMAYELLSGHLPFLSRDFQIMQHAVLNRMPEPISTLSDDANEVLQQALAKNPAERFGSCQEFVTALNGAWTSVASDAPVVSAGQDMPMSLFKMSYWGWAATFFSVVLLFVIGAIALTGSGKNGTNTRDQVLRQPVADVENPIAVVENNVPKWRELDEPIVIEPGTTDRIQQQQVDATPQQMAGDRMVLTINGIEYPFRWCPPGTFMMGSPANEPDREVNETQHQVTLSHGFWLLETTVTQGMWEGVMENNPSHFKGNKQLPVETVSWNDCQECIQRLNGLGVAPAGYRFTLPTEAQWEYACRAGTTTIYHFGNTLNRDQANFGRNVGRTSNVGAYPANTWFLYDMHGNVWEWCMDRYGDYPRGNVIDPTGASEDSNRVFRGGGWDYSVTHCRSARRDFWGGPSYRQNNLGFRLCLVRVEPQQPENNPQPAPQPPAVTPSPPTQQVVLPNQSRPPNIFQAVTMGTVRDIEDFVRSGTNVNVKDNMGDTPLHRAVVRGNMEIMQYLVSQGADINAKNNLGRTPLHNAAASSSVSVLTFLISQGANVDVRDNMGRTPLNLATTPANRYALQYAQRLEGNR